MRIVPRLLILLILTASCAGSIEPNRLRHITGTWRTGQDMIVVIGPGDEHGYTATIKTSPGFTGGEFGPGAVIISGIRSQADGTFSGSFVVPGADPASVRIALVPPDQLMIVTRDKRVRGGTMVWRRVRGSGTP